VNPSLEPAAAPAAVQRLRLLHLERSEREHQAVLAQLRQGGIEPQPLRVDSREKFHAALGAGRWHVVLSDRAAADIDVAEAMSAVRRHDPLLPFVMVCQAADEPIALAAMRGGATDYLTKDNLARLASALQNAVEMAQLRRAHALSESQLKESRERLSALAQHLQTSVESERAAIAREIHDDVGGALTAVKFDLAWMARHAQGPGVAERAQQAVEAVNHAIEASQRVMHNLRPAILEQGLVAALQWMTARFERRTGITTTFRTSHEQLQLPNGMPLVAYRCAQEALTNISKHAQATRVDVDLAVAGDVLSLEINDNGRGLTEADLAKARSFGIRGLHERAGTVGGWIDLTSSPRGTSLILSVPLSDIPPPPPPPDTGAHDPSTWGSL
jgi:signal transduction histidine kinase